MVGYDPIYYAVSGDDSGFGTSGQDRSAVATLSVCEWNDAGAFAALLDDDVAAVIMEPIPVNGGCFPLIATISRPSEI